MYQPLLPVHHGGGWRRGSVRTLALVPARQALARLPATRPGGRSAGRAAGLAESYLLSLGFVRSTPRRSAYHTRQPHAGPRPRCTVGSWLAQGCRHRQHPLGYPSAHEPAWWVGGADWVASLRSPQTTLQRRWSEW